MSSWSQNRKLLYGGTTILVIVALVIVLGVRFFYKAPSCSDGLKNGDEQGIDCGGSCLKLCQNNFLASIVSWTRFEEVSPHLYNVAVYIINPNIDGEARDVPYHVQLYDNRGIIITEYNGTITLPPHRNALAFQDAINVGERVPAKALFEFTQLPDWHKQSDRLMELKVPDKKYSEDENGSSLIVTLKNSGVLPMGKISVYAILYDKNGNALGFSKTIVDGIPANETVLAPFTWARNHQGSVVSIEVLLVAE
jgi:hypothetical protein